MTEALAQNNENITSTADILLNLKNGNLASRKNESNDTFSNLINTLDANTQKVQTDFVKKAAKTNTSSINKLAIKDNAQKTNNKENTTKSTENNFQKDFEIDNTQKKSNTTEKTEELTKVNTNKNTDKKIENDENTTVNYVDSKVTINNEDTSKKQDLSDINNSSPVEPSPVFSLNETTNDEDIQLDEQDKKDIKDIVSNILISLNLDISKNEDLNSEIDETISKIETLDEIPNAIDEIFATLDNLDFSEENKENLSSAFEQIKNCVNNTLKNVETGNDFIAQAKEFLDKITLKSSDNDENNLNEIELSKPDNTTKEIHNDISTKELDNKNEVTQEIKDILNEIKDSFEKSDFQKVEELSKNLDDLLDKTNNSDLNTNINKDLIKDVENLQLEIKQVLQTENKDDSLKTKNNIDNILKTLEQNNNKEIQNSKDETIIELDNIKIDNDEENKNSLNEILEIFDKFQNSSDYEKLSDEDKQKFNDFVEKITEINNQPKDNSIEINKKIVQETLSEIKNTINNIQENPQNDGIEINPKENISDIPKNTKNTIDLTEIFEQSKNSSDNENYLNQNNSNTYKDEFSQKTQTIEVDFNNNEIEITQENIQENEVNIQKEAFVDALQDDMLLDINFQNEAESGALSVADEVAKMALNQQNSSLNTTTTVHGAISYDNLAPEVSMIKNAAQMMKTQNVTSPTQNDIGGDIFNQITNKITQLKDAQGQKLTMVLRPHNLGRLSIELTTNHLGLTTNILAQNDDVRAYIEKNIDSLRQQLSDAGVNVNNIQIKTMGQEGSTNYQGNNNNFDQNQQNQQNQNTNSQNQQKNNHQEQKDNREFLADMTNYDMHFAKDFSSVLNKTISYNLNQ